MPNKSWFPTPWSDRARETEPSQGFKTQLDSLFEDWFGRDSFVIRASGPRAETCRVSAAI